mgnify:CR=1 FL=1|jgi:hypothetical protein|tara:strand:+ start:933 stop:2351 length:1419 start_codon:yes stop_codon:yes gene_type:complete
MLIKEVDSKINNFIDTGVVSPKAIIRKRIADLIDKDYRKEIFLDKKNVLRPKHRVCINSTCRSTNIKYNGYHPSTSFILQNIGMRIRVGQCECNDCGLRWSVDAEELYQLLENFKEEVREFATQIRSEKTSLNKTASLIATLIGKTYSHTSIDRWYKARTDPLQEEKIRDEDCSGYYAYDEQEIKEGGKKKQRLTLRDVTIKQPVAEEIKDDKKKERIREFLVSNLENKPRISMIVDGDTSYPDIITNDLKMNYQISIKHLFDNIRKAFKEECAYGVGHKKLHLVDELKKQELYDVFYPRRELISFVKRGLKRLDKIKDENLREEKDVELQKELMELKNERKKKRRRKGYVHEHKKHTLNKAKKKFDFVRRLRSYYPKKVQEWIDKIEGGWEHYTLFLVDRNVPPTTNWIEQYFSSTLQRSEKKKFRNIDSVNEFLKIQRIKQSGVFLSLISVLGLNFIEIIRSFLEAFLGI